MGGEYAVACPPASLDARALRKALLNLIVNGLEAIGAEGTLTVRTAFRGGAIDILVEDTGCGMSHETQSRIFDLFFTTKPNGTGLGMGIVRSVIDQHGGHMAIDSAPRKGTRVRLHLPAGRAASNCDQGGAGRQPARVPGLGGQATDARRTPLRLSATRLRLPH